jgi:hypothetical protein
VHPDLPCQDINRCRRHISANRLPECHEKNCARILYSLFLIR